MHSDRSKRNKQALAMASRGVHHFNKRKEAMTSNNASRIISPECNFVDNLKHEEKRQKNKVMRGAATTDFGRTTPLNGHTVIAS